MNALFRHILLAIRAMVSFSALAEDEPHDTVYFYITWHQMFSENPDTMIVDPVLDVFSPFEIYVETSDKDVNKRIKNEYIAATLGDSTWLINSHYLRKFFKGDSKKLHGYVPLFFNEKVAYAVAEEYRYAEIGDMGFSVFSTHNYYIDFVQRLVLRLDSKKLSTLLADYPDLRMRYEGMNDNDKTSIMNDFFDRFVARATEDYTRSDILNVVE